MLRPLIRRRGWKIFDPRAADFVPVPRNTRWWRLAVRAPWVGRHYDAACLPLHRLRDGVSVLRSPRGTTYLAGGRPRPSGREPGCVHHR